MDVIGVVNGRALDDTYTPEYVPEIRREYLVIYAAGWPGGINPHPNTLDNARAFVAEHGGELRWRYVSDWVDVPSDEAGTLPRMPRKNRNAGRERTENPPLPNDLVRSKPEPRRDREPRRETASKPPRGRERR